MILTILQSTIVYIYKKHTNDCIVTCRVGNTQDTVIISMLVISLLSSSDSCLLHVQQERRGSFGRISCSIDWNCHVGTRPVPHMTTTTTAFGSQSGTRVAPRLEDGMKGIYSHGAFGITFKQVLTLRCHQNDVVVGISTRVGKFVQLIIDRKGRGTFLTTTGRG